MNAHFFEDFDLPFESTAVKTIAGDAHHQHTARGRVAVKDGNVGIAHASKIVGAAQSGRAGADDGDLLLIGDIDGTAADRFGDIAFGALKILLGNELLDFVDGKRLVKRAAGAGILTAAIADITADRG